MAVTYAWRLDANKYAYIVSPTGDYGYVSDSPLVGDELNSVALIANYLFGEGKDSKGLGEYTKAYKEMVEKIKKKEEWGNAQFYDLLSADVYYNVDSFYCADLRGVGIRGIRYLGACDANKWDPVNPSWNPIIQPDDTDDLAGKFSVYGIYMEDQEINSNTTPENIFAVYNGTNGTNGTNADGSASTADLERDLNKEIERSIAADEKHNDHLQALQKTVDDLNSLGTSGDITTLVARIETLEDENKKMKNTISGLTAAIEKMQEAIDNILDPSGGGGTTGGASFAFYNGEEVHLVGTDGTNLYELSTDNSAATYSDSGITALSFYQSDN